MIARDILAGNMDVDTVTNKSSTQHDSKGSAKSTHWLSPPESIRRVFNQFPLRRFKENRLPQRVRHRGDQNVLFIFTTSSNPASTNLSCNPACLRWQAYLKFCGIIFSVRPSNNHASPSGALPFLIPAQGSATSTRPVPSNKMSRWMSTQGISEGKADLRQETYTALIEQNIRNAWLYSLYLEHDNFEAVARPLYITPCSSNQFVQMALAYQLKQAAQQELLKSRDVIDREIIYAAADKGLQALSTLLGEERCFANADTPGLFDASVFAYTHLLLDENLRWQNSTMQEMVQKYPRLISHRQRMLEICVQERTQIA